ncbi:MAG: gfo/Idh/MocA family oxidoreductase [Chloroflexi bacterium]|nr:gfo/Idh/MocA family oxidoreductase [Chloroflexota bacterium]MDL1884650.1 Gfo/Idh/MocA family oxidoreductase [Anaerolineae bacterium CFX8]
MTLNFALIGAAGFVAPRHLKAIKDVGGELVAALDTHDSVGILDSYFPNARFFTQFERFERHLNKLHLPNAVPVDYVSICSPNYLHDTHIRLALGVGAHAICEKPLVINPWNLDPLTDMEQKTGKRVYTILQLRLTPLALALKERVAQAGKRLDVVMTYVTRRGAWYHVSWKGDEEKSGGLVVNIGIHLFDLLLWLFGPAEHSEVHLRQPDKMAGVLEMEKARARWYLSVDAGDLPPESVAAGVFAARTITLDGESIELSEQFTGLHTLSYERILAGQGFGVADARPSIELVYRIRHADVTSGDAASRHPLLNR